MLATREVTLSATILAIKGIESIYILSRGITRQAALRVIVFGFLDEGLGGSVPAWRDQRGYFIGCCWSSSVVV